MVDGRRQFAIQYYSEAEMPDRCLQEPRTINHRVLEEQGPQNTKFGYFFLVNPGVTLKKFYVGRVSQEINIPVP